jgi:hypothetical protein
MVGASVAGNLDCKVRGLRCYRGRRRSGRPPELLGLRGLRSLAAVVGTRPQSIPSRKQSPESVHGPEAPEVLQVIIDAPVRLAGRFTNL